MVKRKLIFNITASISVLWPFLFVFIVFNIPVGETVALYLAGISFVFCSFIVIYFCYLVSVHKNFTKKEIIYIVAIIFSVALGLLLQYWLVFGLWKR